MKSWDPLSTEKKKIGSSIWRKKSKSSFRDRSGLATCAERWSSWSTFPGFISVTATGGGQWLIKIQRLNPEFSIQRYLNA
jgi:hypothetical protein